MTQTFTIFGEPKGKGRPRLGKFGTYTPEATANYENLVKVQYMTQCHNYNFEDKPLYVYILAYKSIPQQTSKKKRELMLSGEILPTKKVDNDNLEKIIFDALNKIAYNDDSQIVTNLTDKRYGSQPMVIVTISDDIPPLNTALTRQTDLISANTDIKD